MGETLTPIVIVTLAEALFVASASEIAVTVAAGGFGTVLGAVKIPEALIVPKVAFPPVTPFTCHVTTVFVVPVMVAKKNCVLPAVTLACVGEITIPTETRCGGMEPEPPPQPGNENNDETTMAARMGRRLRISPSIFSRKIPLSRGKAAVIRGKEKVIARHSKTELSSTRHRA